MYISLGKREPLTEEQQKSFEALRSFAEEMIKKIPVVLTLHAGQPYNRLNDMVDGEIFVHLSKGDREKYLTVQRGKHRPQDPEGRYLTTGFHEIKIDPTQGL